MQFSAFFILWPIFVSYVSTQCLQTINHSQLAPCKRDVVNIATLPWSQLVGTNTPPNTASTNTWQKHVTHCAVQCALEIQSACYSKTQMQNTSKQMAFKYVKKILITLTCIRYVHGHPLRMGMKLLIPQTIFLLCTSTRLRRIRTDAGHQLVTDQHLQALKHLLLSLFYVFVWLRFVNLY